MMFGSAFLAVALLAQRAFAHMEMTNPPPLGSPYNKFSTMDVYDYDMKSPLAADGSNFPCRGHLNLLDGASGASVATWAPGSTQSLTIAGSAWHNGGSCQALLSFDKGNSWTVIKSWIGNCPIQSGGTFSFVVPSDTPSGKAVFAWTWFNRSGNREMYQNCASITISGGSGVTKRASVPFSSRPAPFVANVGNGCATIEGGDVVFPNPGPDVENTSSNPNQPSGNCGGSSNPNTGGNLHVDPTTDITGPTSTDITGPTSTDTPVVPQSSAAAGAPTDTTGAPTTDQPTSTAPAPAASSSGGKKQCKRYRKRHHPRRATH